MPPASRCVPATTRNPAKSALQIPVPDDNVCTIDHREPVLRIARTYVTGETHDTFSIALTTDGRETVIERGDLNVRAQAYWDGDVLAFDSTVTRGGVEGTNAVRYTLSANGASFVADERFRSALMRYDNWWWMDRVG